ncbi:methyltransferase family protein [Halalkalicoccus ordinarius]|uniref:methyltransferase family protein n=1 Tax=Halalkalicoccus ordinarius TaxID=3116651 RepID=UPI00300EE980
MATPSKGRWRWANVPIPEPHVFGLFVSVALHTYRPWRITDRREPARTIGWSVVGASVPCLAWAVRTAGDADVEEPAALLTGGPYAFSRNPMYVAWTALYVGIALLSNSLWPFVLSPAVLAATHGIVRREERLLARAFGDEYRTYRRDVPRYL